MRYLRNQVVLLHFHHTLIHIFYIRLLKLNHKAQDFRVFETVAIQVQERPHASIQLNYL